MISEEQSKPSASVAVIVPVYNRRTTVIETLNGVVRQSLLPRRLIVVDDGSGDGSAAAVQEWLDRANPPFAVRLIRQKNCGVSVARNRALAEAADCEYVAFLDSDDIWPADFLARACEVLAADRASVAATCDRQFVTADGDVERLENLESISDNATEWLFLHDAGIASASLFRTEALQELAGFRQDLQCGEDLDLFVRLSLRGNWSHIPGASVTFQREIAATRGEAGNLSIHFDDKCRRVARIYDDLATRYGVPGLIPRRLCARTCSRYWNWAGRELLRAGRATEARECFQRSTHWQFWNKAWLRWAQTYVTRAA